MLLLKVTFVVVAITLGYTAKTYYVKAHDAKGTPKALYAEMIGLTIVILLTAFISSIHPTPSDKQSLTYHEMGEEIHYTVNIYPNAPGPNQFELDLWTLEEDGEVQKVVFSIMDSEKENSAERQYVLTRGEQKQTIPFSNFVESKYELEEMKIPYPSKWNATVDVLFEDGYSRSFTFKFEN